MTVTEVSVAGVSVAFRRRAGIPGLHGPAAVAALDDISIDLRRHETLALVGESGSGKTTLGRAIVGLQAPTSGQILIGGQPLALLLRKDFLRTRRRLQIIFQDPGSSLTPWMTVGKAIAEPLLKHKIAVSRSDALRRAAELLELVGLSSASAGRYPGDLSGGQRQRVAIARAIGVQPEVLVCDEITSGLDASVRARIVNLLADIRSERPLTQVFITHDLHLAQAVSNRVAVLQAGRLVEIGDAAQVFEHPEHPYTRRLRAAQPTLADLPELPELPDRAAPPNPAVSKSPNAPEEGPARQ
jgi:peptide/nickel transport system ATP-binding protein